MAVVTVAFEDLNTWLQNQPTNTADTPYELNITGLTASNIGSSLTTGTLGNVIKTNSTKYVDLEATTLPVVNSLQYCFQLCGKLVKSPVIPNGVTNMENCFFGCTSLTAAPVIPDSVTNMSYCFSQCITLTTAPNVPNNVTNILRCFQGCKSLTTAPNIPNGVTSLEACFNGCTSLTIAPNIPNGVTNLRVCFTDCTSLTTAPNIPNSVTNMEGCFANCTSLTTWKQSNTLDNITNYLIAFDRCTSLVNINTDRPYELKQWLTQIHSASTDNFPNDPANCVYSSYSEVVEVSFSDLNNELSTWSANTAQTPYKLNVTELTANDIVSSETSGSLGYVLRQNNTKYVDLSNTTIPQVTDMESCFESCTSLVGALNIPDTVTNIDYCFNGCTAITKWEQIDLLDNITSYNNAFKSCSNLTNIYADAPYEVNQFLNTLYTASTDNFPNDPESLNYSLCSTPAEIPFSHLNNELSFLPENAANTAYVIKVTELTVNDIGPSLSSGSLGNVLRSNNKKFVDLQYTEIPEGVTDMSESFFAVKSLIKSPVLPRTILNLQACFNGSGIETAPIIPFGATDMSNCFYSTKISEPPIIPDSVVNLQNAFAKTLIVEPPIIPNHVTNMGGCFGGCEMLENPSNIPNGVNDVAGCFSDCHSLTRAPSFPNSVTDLTGCFARCYLLTEVPPLPNSIINIALCFWDCTALTTAPVIPNSVTIMFDCFNGCTSLTTAPNIPNSVTDIRNCFSGCSNLEEITLFEADLEFLVTNNKAQNAFSGCTSLIKIGVPSEPPAESDWHVYRLKFGASTVEGKVYDKTGTAVTIPQTSITKATLKLPIKTDELWFPANTYTDAQIDALIEKVIQYRYTYWNKTVLDPAQKNFVLWADNPSNIKTNIFDSLDASSVGGSGKYISAISETDGVISATASDLATSVESGNSNPVTSNAVNSAIEDITKNTIRKELDQAGWYKIGYCSYYSYGCALKIFLTSVYNYIPCASHSIDVAYGWMNPKISETCYDNYSVFDKLIITFEPNNNCNIFVHYNRNDFNICGVKIIGSSWSSLQTFNFEPADISGFTNYAIFNLGTNGFYVNGQSYDSLKEKTDKMYVDNQLELVRYLPYVRYQDLPSQSTDDNVYFKEWIDWMYDHDYFDNEYNVYIGQANPNYKVMFWGFAYADVYQWSLFYYIKPGNPLYKFGYRNSVWFLVEV